MKTLEERLAGLGRDPDNCPNDGKTRKVWYKATHASKWACAHFRGDAAESALIMGCHSWHRG